MPNAFTSIALSEPSQRVLNELGFGQMTPIQAQSLPILLAGHDLIGQSATGSGKTLAFALPFLERVVLNQKCVQALVLCPTRELATQVAATVRTLGRHRPGLRVLSVTGGMPSGPQRKALHDGVHVVVGTPGRVLDHLQRGLDLNAVQTVVLDEADRMLDMGFQDAVEALLQALPSQRQTVFFSATFPPSIAAMSGRWQRAPKRVSIALAETEQPLIRQLRHDIGTHDRVDALLRLLQEHKPLSALVFCNLKDSVREVAEALSQAAIAVDALHGDLLQRDRDRVMVKFRNGTTRVLVATDVAARGLDITGLAAVVHYELPHTPESYVHRIGRTGRAGAPGVAIALIGARDAERLRVLEQAVGVKLDLAHIPQTDPHQARETRLETATLFVGGGRKDKLRPGDILGALTGEGGVAPETIGRIDIADQLSYVALREEALTTLLSCFKGLRIKGKTFRLERVR